MLDFSPLFENAPMIYAILLTFAAFFLIARVANARQPVALAFAFTPMLLYWTIPQTLV